MRQTHTTLFALTVALVLGGASASLAGETAIGAMKISNAWAPASPEGTKDAPGYFTVTNTGSTPDRLISGSFADAGHIEIVNGAGKATKSIPGGLEIAPGETVTLSAAGPHLMFVDLIGPLEQGHIAQSILRFEKAGSDVVEFTIEGSPKKPAKTAHHGH
jgi:periplasmic copper chaperone A